MKNKLCLFLLCFFFVINIVWGQDYSTVIPIDLTANNWEKYPVRAKIAYIEGLLHGEIIGISNLSEVIREGNFSGEEKISQLWKKFVDKLNLFINEFDKVNPRQIVDGIDAFYQDYVNRDIPVFQLLPLVCKRVKGEVSQESIEKELQKLRAESHK